MVAAAAYRAGEKLYDERRGETHNFTRTTRVKYSEIMLPEGSPARFSDRKTLWNEAEKAEKRKDARLSREVVVALPHELSEMRQKELVQEYAGGFVDMGMIADIAIHEPSPGGRDERNVHAHIMLTTREVTQDGFGRKAREWDARALVPEWRETWEKMANQALERAGRDERIDSRSLKDQRGETIKSRDASRFQVAALGPRNLPVTGAAYYMHQRGVPSAQWDWVERTHEPIRESLSNRDRQIVQMISQAPKRGEIQDERGERREFPLVDQIDQKKRAIARLRAEGEAAEREAMRRTAARLETREMAKKKVAERAKRRPPRDQGQDLGR